MEVSQRWRIERKTVEILGLDVANASGWRPIPSVTGGEQQHICWCLFAVFNSQNVATFHILPFDFSEYHFGNRWRERIRETRSQARDKVGKEQGPLSTASRLVSRYISSHLPLLSASLSTRLVMSALAILSAFPRFLSTYSSTTPCTNRMKDSGSHCSGTPSVGDRPGMSCKKPMKRKYVFAA